MTWFQSLTGVDEKSPEFVRKHLSVQGSILKSTANGTEWQCGRLETPSLAELRERAGGIKPTASPTTICEIVADVQALHCDPENAGALFQVASQFNLLEMTSPTVAPEDGIGRYEHDRTQGPACAIAAGAGTIFRNYFVSVNGTAGQHSDRQIDCLADLGSQLGNLDNHLWEMKNGYALPMPGGLEAISEHLDRLSELDLDQRRSLLRIGTHFDTQVTLHQASHVVSQAYCSALPVSYTRFSAEQWSLFANLILEAAYEATLCAAIENASATGCRKVFLTLLGGGAFGNRTEWIFDALKRSLVLYADCGLDIAIVSYGRSQPDVQDFLKQLDTASESR